MGSKIKILVAFIMVVAATFLLLELVYEKPAEPVKPAPSTVVPPVDAGTPPASVTPVETNDEPDEATIDPEVLTEPRLSPIRKRRPRRAVEKKEEPAEEREPDLKAVYSVKDTTPPKLAVLSPVDRSYTMEPRVRLAVRSEAGARLRVANQELEEKSPGYFGGKLDLSEGMNTFRVHATDAVGNMSVAVVRVTYINPLRVRKKKDRLLALLKQLEEIRAAATEVDQRIAQLLVRIRDARDAKRVPEMSRILRSVRNTRKELQSEIELAIKNIDSSLPSVK